MFRALLLAPIQVYRAAISPFLASRCRFLPTCSDYAQQAIGQHGALAGGWLAIRRLARCHPWGASGIDEVPVNPPVFRCACIVRLGKRPKGAERVPHPEPSKRPPCRPSA